jgi:hypothetical protein
MTVRAILRDVSKGAVFLPPFACFFFNLTFFYGEFLNPTITMRVLEYITGQAKLSEAVAVNETRFLIDEAAYFPLPYSSFVLHSLSPYRNHLSHLRH